MPALPVILLVTGTLLSLVVLAVVLVLAVDRVRVTTDRLLAVRGAVREPLAALQADAARARAHADRLRAAGVRADRGEST